MFGFLYDMTSNGDRVTVAKVGGIRADSPNRHHCVGARGMWAASPQTFATTHANPSGHLLTVRLRRQRHTDIHAQVEDVVQQGWFARVLRAGEFDAIMVLGHMGHDDPLVQVLLAAIRAQVRRSDGDWVLVGREGCLVGPPAACGLSHRSVCVHAQVGGDVQILVETGHTHTRALTRLDSNAVAFEVSPTDHPSPFRCPPEAPLLSLSRLSTALRLTG